MPTSDPIVFAALVARMSDDELFQAFQNVKGQVEPGAFEQAVLDETQIRGLLTRSEVQSISTPRSGQANFIIV